MAIAPDETTTPGGNLDRLSKSKFLLGKDQNLISNHSVSVNSISRHVIIPKPYRKQSQPPGSARPVVADRQIGRPKSTIWKELLIDGFWPARKANRRDRKQEKPRSLDHPIPNHPIRWLQFSMDRGGLGQNLVLVPARPREPSGERPYREDDFSSGSFAPSPAASPSNSSPLLLTFQSPLACT